MPRGTTRCHVVHAVPARCRHRVQGIPLAAIIDLGGVLALLEALLSGHLDSKLLCRSKVSAFRQMGANMVWHGKSPSAIPIPQWCCRSRAASLVLVLCLFPPPLLYPASFFFLLRPSLLLLPSKIFCLRSMPLTVNGKVDRKALLRLVPAGVLDVREANPRL